MKDIIDIIKQIIGDATMNNYSVSNMYGIQNTYRMTGDQRGVSVDYNRIPCVSMMATFDEHHVAIAKQRDAGDTCDIRLAFYESTRKDAKHSAGFVKKYIDMLDKAGYEKETITVSDTDTHSVYDTKVGILKFYDVMRMVESVSAAQRNKRKKLYW